MARIDFIEEFGHEDGPGGLPVLPPHRNPGLEIVYVRHGHLVWQCEGRAEVVPPESVFFTLPWQEHGSVLEYEPGHEWFFVVIHLRVKATPRPGRFDFPESFGFDHATTRAIGRRLSHSKQHTWAASPAIAFLLPALVAELKYPSGFHASRVRHLCSQIILELAGLVDAEGATASPLAADRQRISTLIEELDRDFALPWRTREMAERVGLHRTQFATLFHHCTGDTPRRFLHRLRIEKSRRMLKETNRSITDIALDCGFSSSQHFANVFRRFTGVAATAFRREKGPAVRIPQQVR